MGYYEHVLDEELAVNAEQKKSDESDFYIQRDDVIREMEIKMRKPGNPKNYSEKGFWKKLKYAAHEMGNELTEKSLILYYTVKNDRISTTDKTIIYSALGYLIFPFDTIPDITPAIGFSDDIAVIGMTLLKVASCIDEIIKSKAKKKTAEIFS